jgi:hypothetical protein
MREVDGHIKGGDKMDAPHYTSILKTISCLEKLITHLEEKEILFKYYDVATRNEIRNSLAGARYMVGNWRRVQSAAAAKRAGKG